MQHNLKHALSFYPCKEIVPHERNIEKMVIDRKRQNDSWTQSHQWKLSVKMLKNDYNSLPEIGLSPNLESTWVNVGPTIINSLPKGTKWYL